MIQVGFFCVPHTVPELKKQTSIFSTKLTPFESYGKNPKYTYMFLKEIKLKNYFFQIHFEK